jgi:hypothetical protein
MIYTTPAVVPLPPALYSLSPVYPLERVLSETRLLWSGYILKNTHPQTDGIYEFIRMGP